MYSKFQYDLLTLLLPGSFSPPRSRVRENAGPARDVHQRPRSHERGYIPKKLALR